MEKIDQQMGIIMGIGTLCVTMGIEWDDIGYPPAIKMAIEHPSSIDVFAH